MLKQGLFYFIRDEYFDKYDPDYNLMRNKGDWHGRPCFCAFQDKQNPDIYWFVPVSSQVRKYDEIVKHKLDNQIAAGIKKPNCNTIRYGKIMGVRKVFLIQNMFPVSEKYIENLYYDKNNKRPVTVPPATAKDIYVNAKDILKLVTHGYTKLVFSPILKTKSLLLDELQQEYVQKLTEEFSRKNKAEIHKNSNSLSERIAAAQRRAEKYNAQRSPPRNYKRSVEQRMLE